MPVSIMDGPPADVHLEGFNCATAMIMNIWTNDFIGSQKCPCWSICITAAISLLTKLTIMQLSEANVSRKQHISHISDEVLIYCWVNCCVFCSFYFHSFGLL